MPLRVVVTTDGGFEVIDGFKRLERWREAGAVEMPVVVEHCSQSIENKRLLLQANSPRKSITPLDEALVVHSLVKDDKLTLKATAKFLGRKVGWVSCRLALSKICRESKRGSCRRGLGVFSGSRNYSPRCRDEQNRVLDVVKSHGLRSREAILLVQTYRVASPAERKELMNNPYLWCDRKKMSLFRHEQKT